MLYIYISPIYIYIFPTCDSLCNYIDILPAAYQGSLCYLEYGLPLSPRDIALRLSVAVTLVCARRPSSSSLMQHTVHDHICSFLTSLVGWLDLFD